MTNAEIYQPFKKGHYLIDGFLLVLICVAGFSCYFTYDIPATIDVDINLNLDIKVDEFMMYFYTAYSLPSAVSAMCSGYIINLLGLGPGGMILAFLLAVAHVMIAYAMYAKSSLLACAGRILHGSASEPFGVVRSAFTAKYFNSALFYGLILAFSRAGSVGGIKLTPIVLCYFKSDSPSCVIQEKKRIEALFQDVALDDSVKSTLNASDLYIVENHLSPDYKPFGGDKNSIIVPPEHAGKEPYHLTDAEVGSPYDLKTALAICFMVGTAVSVLGVIIMYVIHRVDQSMDKRRGLNTSSGQNKPKKESLKLSDMTKIPISAWVLIYVFTVWYSAMFPFNSMLPGYMKTHCGYSKDVAANLASIVYAFSVVGSPTMGFIIDRTKHHSVWLFLSSALMTSTFLAWGYLQPRTDREVMVKVMTGMMCSLGVAYSIIASSLMAYLADITPLKLHSTCFGLLFGVQQLGVGLSSWFCGWFCKNMGYGNLPFLLAIIGVLAAIGNIVLLFRDGLNPLKNGAINGGDDEVKNVDDGNVMSSRNVIQDITVSRLSFDPLAESRNEGECELRDVNSRRIIPEDFDEVNPFLHSSS